MSDANQTPENSVIHDDHASPIQTPKQLLIVIAASFLIPIISIGLIAHLVIASQTPSKQDPAMAEEKIAQRLQPVGQVNVVDANAPKVEKSGKEVVDSVCAACHAAGALGAPKIGDKAGWGARLAQGLPMLVKHAITGIRQMPARGGNPDLSDTEVARAVVYITNQSGASFKEPAEPKSAPALKTSSKEAKQ